MAVCLSSDCVMFALRFINIFSGCAVVVTCVDVCVTVHSGCEDVSTSADTRVTVHSGSVGFTNVVVSSAF